MYKCTMYKKSKPIPIVSGSSSLSNFPKEKFYSLEEDDDSQKIKSASFQGDDQFWMNSPSDEDKEERKEILQLYHFQSICKAAQPKLSALMNLQQQESIKQKSEEIMEGLGENCKKGENCIIVKFFNPSVAIEISKLFKSRGYTVMDLPCKTTDVARFYIAHVMVDDQPIRKIERN